MKDWFLGSKDLPDRNVQPWHWAGGNCQHRSKFDMALTAHQSCCCHQLVDRTAFAGGMEDWFLGSKDLPDSMFNLGIGPVINASIIVGAITTLASLGLLGPGAKTQLEQFKEGGQEVRACIAM